MAGSISLSLSQQLDELGRPLSGGQLYFIQAGTTATPQNAFQDSGLTIPHPNPLTLDSAGRVPQLYFADGSIKIRLLDASGVTQIEADNILVVGPSSGGGGGGTVDPTTVLQTGQVALWYATGVRSGFVRANGKSIGSASSGATERANADTLALFSFLYNEDGNLVVSGGRGASAAVDFAADKTIALPDFRHRVPAGLGDMGNGNVGLLGSVYFGGSPTTTLGVMGGSQITSLVASNLPPYTPSGTLSLATSVATSVTTTVSGTFAGSASIPVSNLASIGGITDVNRLSLKNNANSDAGSYGLATVSGSITASGSSSATSSATPTGTFAGTPQGGISNPFRTIQPTILITWYLKL